MIDKTKPQLIKHCYAGVWIGYAQSKGEISTMFYGARISPKTEKDSDKIFNDITINGVGDGYTVGYSVNVEFLYPGFETRDLSAETVSCALSQSDGL